MRKIGKIFGTTVLLLLMLSGGHGYYTTGDFVCGFE